MFKIIFAGTPEFAVPSLTALLRSQHKVIAVYTQPDRPAGRGQKLTASPIKQIALTQQIPVYQPATLRDENEQRRLQELQADLMVVAAYGLILPKKVLNIPKYGCINVHASLLPRWRGAAPIQRAILASDKETGITIMQMNEGLDTGDMLNKINCEIMPEDTSASLQQRLAQLGANILLETLDQLEHHQLKPIPQDSTKATYATKIEKSEAKLNWHESTVELEHKVRAFNPWPVAFVEYQQQIIRIWRAQSLAKKITEQPGIIVNVNKNSIDVATADGILQILELQLSGGKRLSVADFLNSKKDFFKVGNHFS